MHEKKLHYAYASSPDADKYGCKNGCWKILVGETLVAVIDHADRAQAVRYFESLPYPVSSDSLAVEAR